MPHPSRQHQKTQNLLLISKLLDCRDNVSPFTLLLDSVEQSTRPVLREIIRRARNTKTITIFLSFECLSPPSETTHFIKAFALDPTAIQTEVKRIIATSPTSKHLIIIDALHPIIAATHSPTKYITTLLTPQTPSPQTPATSLIAVYHTDIPTPPPPPYQPTPLILLSYLATAILTLHAPHHISARRAAAARSLAAPAFGLADAQTQRNSGGVVQGLGANAPGAVVVEAEIKRRSGREVSMWFVLDWGLRRQAEGTAKARVGADAAAEVVLLDEHPLFAPQEHSGAGEGGMGLGDVSFDLGMTEKQRRDREGVVLPYFDAQREGGAVGEGGRILYDMGVEDDFDEEEDEI